MKISDRFLHSGPLKWTILYVIIISGIAFLLGSFKPPSLTDNNKLIDSALTINNKKDQKHYAGISKKKEKKSAVNLTKQKKDSTNLDKNPMQEYLEKYNAVDFGSSSYPYTIDYQEKLKNKNAIFYIVISDIFEENGKTYLKAFKSFMGLNVFLKLQCDRSKIHILKDAQFYTYVVAKIYKIKNIFFSTGIDTARSEDQINVDINLASNDKNIMITGKCLDMFER
jgi:hypothetical protein